MRKKKNETVPVTLLVFLLFICTAVAGSTALLLKDDFNLFAFLSEKNDKTIVAPTDLYSEASINEEDLSQNDELLKIANTYGEMFGLLVADGSQSWGEDKYSADELFKVKYQNGEVFINSKTKKLYWFSRDNVKRNFVSFTDSQLVTKAKEYLASLQLEKSYSHIARKLDKNSNSITIIFQRVINQEEKLFSDYEAVKMILSAQTGELIYCKIFDLPLVEQGDVLLNEKAAVLAVQDSKSVVFKGKVSTELAVCSPIAWGDEENYTSRVVWKILADGILYYVDAYNGDVFAEIVSED